MVKYKSLKLNIEGGVPALANQTIAATLYEPEDQFIQTLLVCLPGGGCNQSYFHSEIPGHTDYSFANYIAEKGIGVLTLDHLGMGKSSQPIQVELLDKTCIAAFNHAAVKASIDQIGTRPTLIGVGHSMGGMALLEQQANHITYDKIAVLGWTNIGLGFELDDLTEQVQAMAYLPTDRASMRTIFHMEDVPEDVVEYHDSDISLTPAPIALQALQPGIVADAAARISCPVYLAYGERDISPNPENEPAFYQNAESICLTVLSGSAHNHNFATTRKTLWDGIATFAVTPN